MSSPAIRWALPLLWCACAHFGPAPNGPERASAAYADALEAGRLDAAFEQSSGVDEVSFRQRYGSPPARHARAQQVRAANEGTGDDLQLVLEAGKWRVRELPALPAAAMPLEAMARATLQQFIEAAEHKDFERAYSMLCASWRGRYTPARLEQDFAHEPLAAERLARARAAADGSWSLTGDSLELLVAPGKTVRLVKEAGALKVVALE